MISTSFGKENLGTQVGINQGQIYIQSDRPGIPQQTIDNEVLRSLAFPQMLDRKDNIEPCHTNTCQWILELEKYKAWESQSRGLLWIKGKPGAGKSTLLIFLHDKLKTLQAGDQGIQLDFFFTARGTEMQRTPLGMVKSLLNQIFDRDETVRPYVREAYEQRCRQFGYDERKWEWPRVVLEDLLASTILASASRQHVTVFVDALDEAGAESAQQLATYFHRLIDRAERKKLPVQICISCRHYPIMESMRAMEIHVEDHNREDIATYIKGNLFEIDAGESPGKEAREVLVDQLVQQSNGVFQWAHLIMPLIRQRFFDGESLDDMRCWLREVPAGLEDVYTYILNNVIEERNREDSVLLFQWVCLAERPLTVTEMRYALAAKNAQLTPSLKSWEKLNDFVESNERMKRRIKALSGGLAEVVSSYNEETVQVIHQSVNDFLRAKGLRILLHYTSICMLSIDRENILCQCQAVLYRSCLIYLASIHMSRGMSNDPSMMKEDIVQNHPLLSYATINLFIHAGKAAGSRADVLQDDQDTLQQVIDCWAQIYRKLERFNTACPPQGTTLLHMAATANLVDVMESVVSNSGDVGKQDGAGNTAFHLAARRGHITAGRILLEKGADREARSRDGITPLIEAASYGHVEFVKWLLHEGAKLEGTKDGNGNALQAASWAGHQNVVEILLGAGAEVNMPSDEYGNALYAATDEGHIEIVRTLLDAHADVNAQGGRYGIALQAAAFNGSIEIVQMLLDSLADVNAQGGEYGNALQAAAYRGNPKIVQMLLDAHANVNAQGGVYGNALQAAAYRGNPKIGQMLLDAHANVNAQGGEYGSALQAAAALYGGNPEIVRMLLDSHADVNAGGGRYGNALQAAAYRGNLKMVQMLLDAHADINAQGGGEYGNALQAAAYRGNPEIVQMLLESHADVNAQGGKYGNALQAAVYKGSLEIARLLLDSHADVNAQGGKYGNSLQAAAYRGNPKMVQMLLGSRANVNAQGGKYGNALQAAAYKGSLKIARLLLDSHADVNAKGGKYGNGLQAAVHEGHSDQVEILLNAGADSLLADELGQTPLHIAASGDMLHILYQFPQLASSINCRDKLLQTPLHRAVYLGHTKFAETLLGLGADPSLADGYGKNIMDWGLGHETLMREIRNHCPQIVLTSGQTQTLAVRRSILEISDTLRHSILNSSWHLIQQLGRYFLFLDDVGNARRLFQLHLCQDRTGIYKITCDTCKDPIAGPRFVCRICPRVDLCLSCVRRYPTTADCIQIKNTKPSKCPMCLLMSLDSLDQHHSN